MKHIGSTSTYNKYWGFRLHTWISTCQSDSCPLYVLDDSDFHQVCICQLTIAQRYSCAMKLTVSFSIFNYWSSSNVKKMHFCRKWHNIWYYKLPKSHWLEEFTWLRRRDFFDRVRMGVVGEGKIRVEGGKNFRLGLAQGRCPDNGVYYVTRVLKL
jgi:hypothetical protein